MYINYFIEEDEEEKELLHWHLGDLYKESGQTWKGSFSAGWLAGWLAGKPDYPQKLKVPEGYEKNIENRNSFSVVSKPNFASNYSFESSWRDLQDLHAFCTAPI